ncbi:DUF4192 domain-containing protein, partial [Micromonospora noduli]|uniref:DUF4192 domain-containing protein n=1 Tax=Micromonospora noduli TaxID=709876 RepID=UPI0011BE1859
MTSTERPQLAVRSPADLIAAVPYLLGFHPTDSVVAVALVGRQIVFAARADLPDPTELGGLAGHLAGVIRRQGAEAATVVGYGQPERVTPAVDAVRDALNDFGLHVLDALRVTDGRWWSYLCTEPECCPPEGRRYDPTVNRLTASAVFAGQVALPDRGALVAQVAPVDGPAREAARAATARAELRLAELVEQAPESDLLGARALRAAGV